MTLDRFQMDDPYEAIPPELSASRWQEKLVALDPETGRVRGSGGKMGFPRFDLDKLAHDPPEREWIIPGYIPAREVTLFTGPGGAGKSLFAQQLATAVATGAYLLGLPTPGGEMRNALYVTAEDDENELWRRQGRCLDAIGVDRADLSHPDGDWLHLVSLRGMMGNELVAFDREGNIDTTPAFTKLRDTVFETGADLLILDNVGHLFAGNENDRGQVTRFVNALYKLVRTYGVTILLVAHPNKSGDDYSGSTAWRNAVRSQINLARLDGDAGNLDPDARVLSVSKANYSRLGEELRFRWHHGAFVRDEDLPPDAAKELAETIRAAGDNEVFLRCLRARNEQERPVSESPSSRTYAPRIFAKMAEAKGLTEARLEAALERLFRADRIARGVVCNVGRKDREGIIEKCADVRADPALTGCADVRPSSAPSAPAHTPYTTYNPGAASWPAAPDDDDLDWTDGSERDD